MTTKSRFFIAAAIAVASLAATGCDRDSATEPAPPNTDPTVFSDNFGDNVTYQAFLDSKVDAVTIVTNERYEGTASLKVTVPAPGDPAGGFAGGAFTTTEARDLSGYNALTFWAKASMAATLDVAGLGNDNTATSLYEAKWSGIALTTTWTKYVIPIPLAAKLSSEDGLFFFAEGPESGIGYDVWFDEIMFETVSTVRNPRPAIATQTLGVEVGEMVSVGGTTVTFDVGGTDQLIEAFPGYFTFSSSNQSVATVSADGAIDVVGAGNAMITAKLGTVDATGAVELTAAAAPTSAAAAPTLPANEVISLFSDIYNDVTVDTWSAVWDQADVADVQVAGDAAKKYTNLVFAGIEFTSQTIDADAFGATHFHMDVWVPDATAFKLKLVDFGADGAFGGGDDSEHEITLSETSTPALTAGDWNSVDIPLANFTGLGSRAHLAQLILSGSSRTIYVDNVYLYIGAAPDAPTTPAPTPTVPEADVISLFSNAYTDVTVDTWSAVWDQADVADEQVAGDDVKRYTGLVFAGIEFTSQTIDASAMTHFHMDIWTPDPTADPAAFKIKLVDFGPNGTFDGGPDDSEHELTFTASSNPPLATGSWVSFEIPLTDFTGLVEKAHLAQLIISGDPNTVYVDNVYLHK